MNVSDLQIIDPEFMETLKTLNGRYGILNAERQKESQRLVQGAGYFNTDLSVDDVKTGIEILVDINKRLLEIDTEIRDISTQFIIIFEAKLTGVSFRMSSGSHESSSGEGIQSRDIMFVPWANYLEPSENMIIVKPEDIWFIQIAHKLFKANPHDIQAFSAPV